MNECNIVQDLLPLYADDLASPDSVEFIRRHTAWCEKCWTTLQRIQGDLPAIESTTAEEERRNIRRAIRRDRLKTVGQTLLTVLIVLAIVTGYVMLKFFGWGFFDPIEVSYPSPDGMKILEVVERDFIRNTGEGYMIKFNLKGDHGGINCYFTDWDSFDVYWAGDSQRLLVSLVTVDGEREMRIIDTSRHHVQGGTWEIPDMTENILPALREYAELADAVFTFSEWHDDCETVTLSYDLPDGFTGSLDYHYPTSTIKNIR